MNTVICVRYIVHSICVSDGCKGPPHVSPAVRALGKEPPPITILSGQLKPPKSGYTSGEEGESLGRLEINRLDFDDDDWLETGLGVRNAGEPRSRVRISPRSRRTSTSSSVIRTLCFALRSMLSSWCLISCGLSVCDPRGRHAEERPSQHSQQLC